MAFILLIIFEYSNELTAILLSKMV